MRTVRISVLFSGALILAGGCSAPSESKRMILAAEEVEDSGYMKYWETRVPLKKGDAVEKAYLVDENLYFSTEQGYLHAVQAEQGLPRWSIKLTEPGYSIYAPSHLRQADGRGPLVVTTTTRTYLMDRYSGRVLSSFSPEFAPGSGTVGDENHLYMGGLDGKVHCLIWNHPFGSNPILKWEVSTGGPVRAHPLLFGPDKLIFTSESGLVAGCFSFDKAHDWNQRVESAIVAAPYVDSAGVYVASMDRSLYKFNPHTGGLEWRYRFPKPLRQSPVVTRNLCFQFCPSVGFTAIEADTGREKWVRSDVVSFIAGHPDTVAVLTASGRVEALDLESGQTRQSIDLGTSTPRAVVNPIDDRVILFENKGEVVCIRPDDVPFLRRQQVLAARNQLESAPPEEVAPEPEPLPAATPSRQDIDPFRSERD